MCGCLFIVFWLFIVCVVFFFSCLCVFCAMFFSEGVLGWLIWFRLSKPFSLFVQLFIMKGGYRGCCQQKRIFKKVRHIFCIDRFFVNVVVVKNDLKVNIFYYTFFLWSPLIGLSKTSDLRFFGLSVIYYAFFSH